MNPLRVLVADDSRDTVDSMAFLLRLWGHQAFPAQDVAAALAAAHAGRPDVALLDLALPRVTDGCALARQIRPAVPLLVAITGCLGVERECAEVGFDLVIAKPADPQPLRDVLSVIAAARESAEEFGRACKGLGAMWERLQTFHTAGVDVVEPGEVLRADCRQRY